MSPCSYSQPGAGSRADATSFGAVAIRQPALGVMGGKALPQELLEGQTVRDGDNTSRARTWSKS